MSIQFRYELLNLFTNKYGRSFRMADIAEITKKDREKIKNYVDNSKFLTYKMLADRFNIDKSNLSLILNGKRTSAEANRIIDSIITMYEL